MKKSPQESFLSFKESIQTLQLSTLTAQGKPNASYAPFIEGEDEGDQGCFYIFTSQLASHTQDLLAHPEASILLIQDEAQTRQIFARQRISYQCDVESIDASDPRYEKNLNALEKCFGNVVSLLKTLPDFILFRLIPTQGQYVMGFGKAYTLIGDDLLELEQIQPK